jgi:prephenate dehydratase
MGFRTFKKYLELPDYDNLQASPARVDAIVTNTASWLTNLESVEEIRQDVEHNYTNFIQLGKAMETDLLQQIRDNGLQAQVKDIMPTVDIL